MNLSRRVFLAIGVLAAALVGMASPPPASFEVSSGTPSAGAPVLFTDTSTGGPTSWRWTFGDGSESALQNPTHVYPAAGVYPVTLRVSGSAGTTETTLTLEVLPPNTLRLMARTGRSFDVTLEAIDPRSGDAGEGQAVPQNDVFGYFSMPSRAPAVPGAPITPEVFVKMQDARDVGGDYWVFWGGLTDLTYTLTIRDTQTGVAKVHRCSAADTPTCLGVDTSGFLGTSATRIVNVGQGGNAFVDEVSGGRQTTIGVGDTVQWNWVNGTHSSTSGECSDDGDPYGGGTVDCQDSGVWNSGTQSVPFQYPRTFTAPGTYRYYCAVHGAAMTGVVIVSETTPGTTPTPTRTPVIGTQQERVVGDVVSRHRDRETRLVARPTGGPVPSTPTPTPTSNAATPTPTPTTPAGQTRVVDVRDIFFRDRVSGNTTTTITVGTKVEWEWEGNLPHSTTSGNCPPCSPDGIWNSGTKSSGSFDHTFSQAGTFPYYCTVHGTMMTGTVIVNP